jgi:hypothetical protein
LYPSEYAYHDSVNTAENASAKCRNYPAIPANIRSVDYIHCDGTQLKLADDNLGLNQTSIGGKDYQWWSTVSDGKLLFIFPMRVFLTIITLHYYSDSLRGRPRLRFYAVPDDFDVWDSPTTSISCANVTSVRPGREATGRRNVSINVNFNTTKVLMYKFNSNFQFAVSEVQFFTYYSK